MEISCTERGVAEAAGQWGEERYYHAVQHNNKRPLVEHTPGPFTHAWIFK